MGIIGMLIAMGVPGFAAYTRQVRLRSVTRQVLGLLSLARASAIGARTDHGVVVDLEAGTVTVVNVVSEEPLEQVVRLPPGVRIELQSGGEPSGSDRVVFRPTGAVAGRNTTVVLADRDRERRISVMAATGAVTLEPQSP